MCCIPAISYLVGGISRIVKRSKIKSVMFDIREGLNVQDFRCCVCKASERWTFRMSEESNDSTELPLQLEDVNEVNSA